MDDEINMAEKDPGQKRKTCVGPSSWLLSRDEEELRQILHGGAWDPQRILHKQHEKRNFQL